MNNELQVKVEECKTDREIQIKFSRDGKGWNCIAVKHSAELNTIIEAIHEFQLEQQLARRRAAHKAVHKNTKED